MKTIKILSLLTIVLIFTFSSCSKDEDTKKVYTDIYFMDSYNEDIESVAITGGTPSVLAQGIYGVGIAYDKKNEKIYYSDFANDSLPDGKIWKMDIDGKNATAIVSGLNNPFGIAIDSENGKIYWGDEDGNVSCCKLDGSNLQKGIVNIDGGAIRAIALDLTNDKLYFYEVNNNNLYRANLDGKNASVILNGYYGYGIAVDEVNSKIYFDAQTDDETVSALYMANLDGTNPTLIDDTKSRIYGIAIDNENSKIYWSGRDTYEIYQANLNGTDRVTLATELGSPRGIFLKY
jgi:DNA-binding beta-propeller fold protein YncE